MQGTVKRLVAGFVFLLAWSSALAQFQSRNAPVTVRGQVFAPNGAPLQTVLRLQLICEDTSRPPEYYFTDSKGGFVLAGLDPRPGYTIVVESDGANWDTTVERFIVQGPRTMVNVHLNAFTGGKKADKSSVSVAEMRQQVPRAARREFDFAIERLQRGETEKARGMLERAIELYPDYVDARNELAVLLMKEGQLIPAEAQLRRALESDPQAVRPLLNLGLCLYRQQRYTDAIPVLERAVQLEPVQPQGHLVLGFSLVMSGDDKRAEPVLLRAYEQGGKKAAKAQLYLSRIYTRRQDYARAARALEIYLSDAPDQPDAPQLQVTLAKLRASSIQQ